jgi:hypothetical protein
MALVDALAVQWAEREWQSSLGAEFQAAEGLVMV